MARKSRYTDYYKGAMSLGEKKKRSTQKSVLSRLKELKNQERKQEV